MQSRLIKASFIITVAMLLAATLTSATPNPIQGSEMRCGWFSNPTPANASLFDADAEWLIGVQGGYQADGDWPEFAPNEWVKTNVHYGYGCACMRVRVDRSEKRVITIETARSRPLSTCRKDRALRRWGFK